MLILGLEQGLTQLQGFSSLDTLFVSFFLERFGKSQGCREDKLLKSFFSWQQYLYGTKMEMVLGIYNHHVVVQS